MSILFVSKILTQVQVFIEPKGKHLKDHDEWKDKFSQEITEKYVKSDILTIDGEKYRLIGLPLYNNDDKYDFESEYKKLWSFHG